MIAHIASPAAGGAKAPADFAAVAKQLPSSDGSKAPADFAAVAKQLPFEEWHESVNRFCGWGA